MFCLRWRLNCFLMFCYDFWLLAHLKSPQCPSLSSVCVSLSFLWVLSVIFADLQVGWGRTIFLSWLSFAPCGDKGSLTVEREWNLHCCVPLKFSAPGSELSKILQVVSFIYLFVCLCKVLNMSINAPNLCGFTLENVGRNSATPGYLLCLWNTAPSELQKGRRS